MARKRETLEDDFTRLAENLKRNYGRQIRDKASFDNVYEEYLFGKKIKFNYPFKEKVWDAFVLQNPSIGRDSLHRRAGGKNFLMDRKKRASIIVNTPEEYIRRGADKVDLKNYDLPTNRIRRHDFNKIGKIKNKIVYGRKDTFKKGSKVITRYRDRKGRFIKIT